MVVSRMRHTALAESNVLGEERKVCVAREAEKQQHGRERRAECRCAAWCAASCHGAPHTRGRDIRPWRMMGESTTDCLTSRAGTPAQAHAQRGGRPRSGVQRDGSGSGWSVRIQRSSSEEQQRDAKKRKEGDKSEAELTESRARAEERREAQRTYRSAEFSECVSVPGACGFFAASSRVFASWFALLRSLAAAAASSFIGCPRSRGPIACLRLLPLRVCARPARRTPYPCASGASSLVVRSLSFACLFALAATSSARRR